MAIGTSLGAFYEDEFHQAASEWDPSKDENDPSTTNANWFTDLFDNRDIKPHVEEKKDIQNLLDNQILGKGGAYSKDDWLRWDRYREDSPGPLEWGRTHGGAIQPGTDTGDKIDRKPDTLLGLDPTNDNNVMPTDTLYKRPGGLIHRVADRPSSQAAADSFKGGYLGVKPRPTDDPANDFWFKDDWQNTWDSALGKHHYKDDPEGYVKSLGPDYEGFTQPDSELLWLRKRGKPPAKIEDLVS